MQMGVDHESDEQMVSWCERIWTGVDHESDEHEQKVPDLGVFDLGYGIAADLQDVVQVGL